MKIKHLATVVAEAIKKPNATTRHLRQYPVSDKDVAKPVKPEKKEKKAVAEGYTGRETKDGTWHVFKDGKPVAVAGPFKSREEAAAWINKQKQGVAEAAFKDPSPMMKDAIKQDKIRSLKNLIAIAKVKGVQHKVKEYELELKKLQEASVFPYKPPRKGSVAYNALMRQKEQDKKRVKEIEAIGTKNHHVGVAKVTKEEASPMIKPPKNEFGKKEDAFAHAKQHGGKVIKKTFTHPTSGIKTVSYVVKEAKVDRNDNSIPFEGPYTKVKPAQPGSKKPAGASRAKHLAQLMKNRMNKVKEDLDQLDEISLGNYKEKAKKEVKELKPHAKGEYGDFAKKLIAKRKAGLQRAMTREAYMGKVTMSSNPREKWMKSVKDRGYDMRAGAKRLQDLLDKQKKERAEMEQRAKEKGLEY